MKKIPFLFFALIYFNQGFFGLGDSAIYYLTRETWHLNATTLGLFGFITGLAWYCKILFGYIGDRISNHKNILYFTYSSLIFLYLLLIFFPINIWSLLILTTLINFCIGCSDVICDTEMVKTEQKYNMAGRCQSVQWSSLYSAVLITSLLGAFIADRFESILAVKICYAIALIIPIFTLGYLKFGWHDNSIQPPKEHTTFKQILGYFKNHQILLSLIFIACLQLSPSFGNPLRIQMREVLHIDKMFMGYIDAVGIVFGIIGYMIYYKYFYTINLKKLLYFSVIFTALTNLCYLYLPNQWILMLYSLAFGAFSAVCNLTILAFFATLVPKGSEGLIYACITALSNLCSRMSGILGGFIFDHSNYNVTVIVSTVLTLCCLIFLPRLNIGLDNSK